MRLGRTRIKITPPSAWSVFAILTLPAVGIVLFRLIVMLKDNN